MRTVKQEIFAKVIFVGIHVNLVSLYIVVTLVHLVYRPHCSDFISLAASQKRMHAHLNVEFSSVSQK